MGGAFDVDGWLGLILACCCQAKCMPRIDAAVNVENIRCGWLQSAVNDVGSIDGVLESLRVVTKMRVSSEILE